jgi:hypothetical protein
MGISPVMLQAVMVVVVILCLMVSFSGNGPSDRE